MVRLRPGLCRASPPRRLPERSKKKSRRGLGQQVASHGPVPPQPPACPKSWFTFRLKRPCHSPEAWAVLDWCDNSEPEAPPLGRSWNQGLWGLTGSVRELPWNRLGRVKEKRKDNRTKQASIYFGTIASGTITRRQSGSITRRHGAEKEEQKHMRSQRYGTA